MQPTDLPCHKRPRTFMFDKKRKGDLYEWRVNEAKALCARCPMRQACLDRWMRLGDMPDNADEVIVGGTTKAERDALRARACVGVAA